MPPYFFENDETTKIGAQKKLEHFEKKQKKDVVEKKKGPFFLKKKACNKNNEYKFPVDI